MVRSTAPKFRPSDDMLNRTTSKGKLFGQNEALTDNSTPYVVAVYFHAV